MSNKTDTHPDFLSEIPKVSDQDSYELSPAQMGNWLMNTYLKNPGPFNSCILSTIPELHVGIFMEALETLIKRHEILLNTFTLEAGTPRVVTTL